MDTSAVTLGPELAQLLEQLSENNHEIWARMRYDEGWRLGPVRDDALKTHPCLVPYDELPESEKEYDRVMAVAALKNILALGFQIVPPEWTAGDSDRAAVERSRLETGEALDVGRLAAIWREHEERVWRFDPKLYVLLARRFLAMGDPLLAHEVLSEGVRVHPRPDPERDHLLGLSLARGGALDQAVQIATRLRHAPGLDGAMLEEVLGLLGRTHKDLALAAGGAERTTHLKAALDVYSEAARATGGFYPAINAATIASLLGAPDQATRFAQEARDSATRSLQHDPANYWAIASLAEAALILGDFQEAEHRYSEAVALARPRWGSIASMRRQARLLAESRGAAAEWISDVLRIPAVVVFTGHMMDVPGRASPRLPADSEPDLAETLREFLQTVDAGWGFASAASGSDILFLEAMAERGAETTIVLPYPEAEFVAANSAGPWEQRFERARSRASEVIVASGARTPAGSVGFEYGNLLMLGLAIARSHALDTELIPLAVWDGEDAGDLTGSVVRQWRERGYEVRVIPPPRARASR